MFNIHQNFLVVLKLTLARIIVKTSSPYSFQYKLNQQVNSKLLKKLKTNAETASMLKFYASNMENIIKKISTANQNKEIFKIIGDWLSQIQRVQIERIR